MQRRAIGCSLGPVHGFARLRASALGFVPQRPQSAPVCAQRGGDARRGVLRIERRRGRFVRGFTQSGDCGDAPFT